MWKDYEGRTWRQTSNLPGYFTQISQHISNIKAKWVSFRVLCKVWNYNERGTNRKSSWLCYTIIQHGHCVKWSVKVIRCTYSLNKMLENKETNFRRESSILYINTRKHCCNLLSNRKNQRIFWNILKVTNYKEV